MIRPRRLTKVLIDARRVSQSLLRRSLFRMAEHALGCSLFFPPDDQSWPAPERDLLLVIELGGECFSRGESLNASSCALISRETDVDDGACDV